MANNNLETYLEAILDKIADGTETDIPRPSWNIEKYLAAIYEALSEGGGGGGSGGGVLVVTDTDGTLDKTWQEIHDAMLSGGAVVQNQANETKVDIVSGTEVGKGTYYVSCASGDMYSASSASGYPTYLSA